MSLLLRSLLRDPLVTRPLSRAVRRIDDDFWRDDWPLRSARRLAPYETSADLMLRDMNRQMASVMNHMREFADDLEALDSWVDRWDNQQPKGKGSPKKRKGEDLTVKRTESGGLQLAIDVGDFKPEDLRIKLVEDTLVVEAESENSGKDSYRKSSFKRWFRLPEDCKLDEIRSKLTEDNKLLIDLPSEKPLEHSKSRSIPIEMSKKQSEQSEQSTQALNGTEQSGSGHEGLKESSQTQ